jgi:hypothetical protein
MNKKDLRMVGWEIKISTIQFEERDNKRKTKLDIQFALDILKYFIKPMIQIKHISLRRFLRKIVA